MRQIAAGNSVEALPLIVLPSPVARKIEPPPCSVASTPPVPTLLGHGAAAGGGLLGGLMLRPWFIPGLLALLYGGLHLLWYWQTPLGMVAVLDERENIDLARQIASGTLPAEPFYRAMGYPLVLSLFPALGLPAPLHALAATALGLALHVINSILVALLAHRLFRESSGAALLAGSVHALNPVLLHYATQILDGTLATSGFLLGLWCLLASANERMGGDSRSTPSKAPDLKSTCLAFLFWSVAALIRPQFLVLLPAAPVFWLVVFGRPAGRQARDFALGLMVAAAPWILLGLAQQRISGEFRLLPTQGAYNLWVSNGPGADGRFFVQTVHLPLTDTHQNPAWRESRILYERETGKPADSIDEVNAYWSERLRSAVTADPLAWLGLIGRKTYYLLNDFDAYNNKTYAFHKARSPWLAPNPLGWGVLLVAGALGWAVLATRNPRVAIGVAIVCGVIGAGIVLTLVSGRFRTPLTVVLCILGGGLTQLGWLKKRHLPWVIGGTAVTALLTFSGFFNARDTRTYLQDHLLLAASAVETGDDVLAWQEAGAALSLAPGDRDALAWRVTAGFNLLISERLEPASAEAWHQAATQLLTSDNLTHPPAVIAIAGLSRWRDSSPEQALSLWRDRWRNHGEIPSYSALRLAGETPAPPEGDLIAKDPFTVMLVAQQTPPESERIRKLQALARRLFATKADATK